MSHIIPAQAVGLRLSQEIPATPDQAFDAYTQPAAQRVWLSRLGPDLGQVRTTVDLRVGGTWEAWFRPEPAVVVHDVFTFRELDRPHRLVTDHVGESTVGGRTAPPSRTRIALTFAPIESGTLVTVEHDGFADTRTRDFFAAEVWPAGLERLATYLADRR